MLDYPALRAVAAVAHTGSFEKAAKMLNVTPSAVSQRIKNLEDRLGVVLIERATPCIATEKGDWLCRHIEHVGMLEGELFKNLPALADSWVTVQQVTLHIATNADSLGTWFMEAISTYTRNTGHLLNIAVDDQDHTAEWLRRGRVLAAVTSLEKPVPGCRRTSLGALRYRATASPDFLTRYFADGVSAEAIAAAPGLTFNQKDRLQSQWLRQVLGADIAFPTHWLPSTQSFVDASLAGMGWGMNPDHLVREHLKTGRLGEIIPGQPLDVPLYWQVSRLAADQLGDLTQAVVETAHRQLIQPVQAAKSMT